MKITSTEDLGDSATVSVAYTAPYEEVCSVYVCMCVCIRLCMCMCVCVSACVCVCVCITRAVSAPLFTLNPAALLLLILYLHGDISTNTHTHTHTHTGKVGAVHNLLRSAVSKGGRGGGFHIEGSDVTRGASWRRSPTLRLARLALSHALRPAQRGMGRRRRE